MRRVKASRVVGGHRIAYTKAGERAVVALLSEQFKKMGGIIKGNVREGLICGGTSAQLRQEVIDHVDGGRCFTADDLRTIAAFALTAAALAEDHQ